MKLWFVERSMESHRHPDQVAQLIRDMAAPPNLIELTDKFDNSCDAIFIGSFIKFLDCRRVIDHHPDIPVFAFCWDLYPFQINGNPDYYLTTWWKEYVEFLKRPQITIIVPSRCTCARILEFTGRNDSVVCLAGITQFEAQAEDLGYALDVMRKYEDPNQFAARRACDHHGIPLIESGNKVPWPEFKSLVAGARFLISAQYEASTGGLTLLEGHWHGKPVLCSNSPRHGAVDYFGNRAHYFQWDDMTDLTAQVKRLYTYPISHPIEECRTWINQNFSQAAFTDRLSAILYSRIYPLDRLHVHPALHRPLS